MEQILPRRLLETTSGNSSYVREREMNLDGKMVVILAALLCAVVGAVGVKCIIRCVLRQIRPEEAAAKGLKKRDLSQIPVGVYGFGCGTDTVHIKGTDCGICLGEFEEGQKVRMLPICNHGFHLICIDTWLLSHSSCPNCRQNVAVPPPPPEIIGGNCNNVAHSFIPLDL